MTILALLIAFALDRIVVKSPEWQIQFYGQQYFDKLIKLGWLGTSPSLFHWLFIALLPAFLMVILLDSVPTLVSFCAQIIVLFLCLGSATLRATYKCFLQAANRGDVEACYMYSQQMGHCDTKPDKGASFGQRLVWLNYQHYTGVVIWFVAFDAAGAVFYVLVREAFEYCCSGQNEEQTISIHGAQTLRHWVDWLPVRASAFGLLLVGNFAHALPVWLSSLFNVSQSPSITLTEVAAAAEVLPEQLDKESDPTLEPLILVKLAKRNMMFILVVVSFMTVFGIL